MGLGTGYYKDAVSAVIHHTIVTLAVVSALIQFSFSKGNCKSESFCIAATFCEGLPSGDYRDPWDCHKFFKCFVGQIFTFNCQKPPLRELVFHPQLDRCVYPRDFPCLTVKSSTKSKSFLFLVLNQLSGFALINKQFSGNLLRESFEIILFLHDFKNCLLNL